MPDTITHVLFAEKALANISESVDKQAYYLGSIGPDPLYYYKVLSFADNSHSLHIASKIHHSSGKVFLEKGYEYIDTLEEDDIKFILRSYLHGFLIHYILDSTSHPYINEVSKKYPNGHKRFEMKIDTLLLKKTKEQDSRNFEFNSYMRFEENKMKIISDLFAYVVQKGYSEEFDNRTYIKSVDDMRKICNLFRDPYKILSTVSILVERMLNKKDFYRYFFYSYQKHDEPDYLNITKKLYDRSFPEIIDQALEKHKNVCSDHDDSSHYMYDFNGSLLTHINLHNSQH